MWLVIDVFYTYSQPLLLSVFMHDIYTVLNVIEHMSKNRYEWNIPYGANIDYIHWQYHTGLHATNELNKRKQNK